MKTITAYTRDDFRTWLEKHHKTEKRVTVIVYKKHTGKPVPSHRQLMEEAICFGWIDTTIKRIDEDRYSRNFSRRNKHSKWSENTLRYGKQLIEEGKMMPQGLKYYKEGLSRPTHDVDIPKNPSMPDELKVALEKDQEAKKLFVKLAPSTKKMFYRWLLSGKRPETRAKRVAKIIENTKKHNKTIL